MWVSGVSDAPGGESKIGAIGVRVRKWVTFHGLSVNLDPNLEHFSGIVPCGISQFGVTSLKALGRSPCAKTWDQAFRKRFLEVFELNADSDHAAQQQVETAQ